MSAGLKVPVLGPCAGCIAGFMIAGGACGKRATGAAMTGGATGRATGLTMGAVIGRCIGARTTSSRMLRLGIG